MIKREQIIQSIYNILEGAMIANKFVLFRNKEFDYEMNEEKLILLFDGESKVIDTVYSPRIDTIEQAIEIELYLNKELAENEINMELAKFEESVRQSLSSYDICVPLVPSVDTTTDIMQLSLTPSETETLDPENGQPLKKSSFNVLVVFDDV
ncbi:MAG TPA: hypothetical protein DCL21_07095 [Alphaproteobacteria bacterium]|nr:hypothetical protein [Alphaproteobacteria bacterium]